MESNVLEKSDVRFTISNEGWKRLNAGRKASDLIREAVSNTFDADDVTEVRIRLEPGFASIEDNSPHGIADSSLVTTVFMTDKQDSANKRGRKGRGLKELISAAEWAEVDTIGFKTTFTNGRVVEKSERTLGTKVTVKVDSWSQTDIDAAIAYLTKIIPPAETKLYINDVLIKTRRLRISIPAVLRTQIVKDDIQREIYRDTFVEVINLSKGETRGWIYEMGIPIQEITARFHVNVCQRVPLNDNRDAVDYYYLNIAFGCVLHALLPSMSAQALRHEWVDMALSGRMSDNDEKIVVRKLYGEDKLALAGASRVANDIAKQHGYKLIDLAGVSSPLELLVRRVVKLATDIVTAIEADQGEEVIPESIAEPTGRVRRLVHYLGKALINKDIDTEYFKKSADFTGTIKMAHFRPTYGIMGFNVNGTPLDNPLHPTLLSTIIHELAHHYTDIHDQLFLEKVTMLGGKLALLMLTKGDEIKLIAEQAPKNMVLIHCTQCPATRYVYPQDVHQVSTCHPCTIVRRKERARARRKEHKINVNRSKEIK